MDRSQAKKVGLGHGACQRRHGRGNREIGLQDVALRQWAPEIIAKEIHKSLSFKGKGRGDELIPTQVRRGCERRTRPSISIPTFVKVHELHKLLQQNFRLWKHAFTGFPCRPYLTLVTAQMPNCMRTAREEEEAHPPVVQLLLLYPFPPIASTAQTQCRKSVRAATHTASLQTSHKLQNAPLGESTCYSPDPNEPALSFSGRSSTAIANSERTTQPTALAAT